MALGNLKSQEDKLQKLQAALHAKAKAEPEFRFYQLYDKVCRQDVLAKAYRRCKSNGGVAGADNQKFKDIKTYGEERWLRELGGKAEDEGLYTGNGEAGLDTEAERQTAAFGNRDDHG